jgi:hypothetical protein
MWKLTVVVVLALAAGIAGANAEKKQSITLKEAKKICGGGTSCGWCHDQKCDHGYEVECKNDKCTKTTWIGTPPKHIPTIGLNKAAAPQRKMPGGGILEGGSGFGGQGPAAAGSPLSTGRGSSPPSGRIY